MTKAAGRNELMPALFVRHGNPLNAIEETCVSRLTSCVPRI